jgi:hypothetical protein
MFKIILFFLIGFSTLQAEEMAPRPVLIASEYVNLVIFVPETHADQVREAMGRAGAGKIGNYDYCSFSVKGIARFRPLEKAKPAFAKLYELTTVNEERIEVLCSRDILPKVLDEIKKVHPYEKVSYHVYSLEEVR